jgi:hypothetical protein
LQLKINQIRSSFQQEAAATTRLKQKYAALQSEIAQILTTEHEPTHPSEENTLAGEYEVRAG